MHISDPSQLIRSLVFAQSSAVSLLNDAPSVVVVSSRPWVALNDSDADADNVYAYECTLEDAAKATGEAWVIGAALGPVVWEDDTHLLQVLAQGRDVEIVRFGLDGSMELTGVGEQVKDPTLRTVSLIGG